MISDGGDPTSLSLFWGENDGEQAPLWTLITQQNGMQELTSMVVS